MKQKLVKNPNWQEADQLAFYKAWRSWIRDHQTQIHLVAGFEPGTLDFKAMQRPNHEATLASIFHHFHSSLVVDWPEVWW